MPRSVPEWIGKHDDQKIPERVRLRVFDRYNGTCQLSDTKIQPGMAWQINHKIELIAGGEHRESNFEPVLVEPHKRETKRQMAVKKKVNRTRKKHIGVTKPKGKMKSAGFEKSPKPKKIDKSAIKAAAVPQQGGIRYRSVG